MALAPVDRAGLIEDARPRLRRSDRRNGDRDDEQHTSDDLERRPHQLLALRDRLETGILSRVDGPLLMHLSTKSRCSSSTARR